MRYIISFLLTSTALTTPVMAEPPRVVTDIAPVHALVSMVMGDLGQPLLLLEKGADEHDFQLRPSQAAQIEGAGLIVWIGPELTPWLDRAVTSLAPETAQLALLDAPQTLRLSYAEERHDAHADHASDETHEGHAHDEQAHAEAAQDDHAHEGHTHEEAGHDHSGTDPHAWLDPDNALAWLPLIAADLSRLDPGNAAIYAANAAAAQSEVSALDARLTVQLAPLKDKPFVAYHDAYRYFTSHYGLTMAGTVALGDASAPGAARITALSQTIAASKAECLFPEAQHDPALLSQLAEASGARTGAPLDPAGSLQDPGPAAYGATLTAIADSLTDCLAAQ